MHKKSPSEQFLIKLRKYIKNYVRENYCPLNCILRRNYINIEHSLASSDDYANLAFYKIHMLLLLTFLQNLNMPTKQILVGETKYYTTVHLEDLSVDDRVILQ
jgi:hypothetical protein